MLLHDEREAARAAPPEAALRLGRHLEVALLPVALERHWNAAAVAKFRRNDNTREAVMRRFDRKG
jgi:hypothetical protein